jgi:hypothetical protein
MLQRGFQIQGQRNWTWRFSRDAEPERSRIGDIGAEDHFYSEPPSDGSETLDGRITNFEGTRLGPLLNRIKGLEVGSVVDGGDASRIIAHLAMRAAHLRCVLVKGLRGFISGAEVAFSNPGVLQRVLGFDMGEPTQRFREAVSEIGALPQVRASGVPAAVVERMMFATAQENFECIFAEHQPAMRATFEFIDAQSEQLVRNSHNKALEHDFEGAVRSEFLAAYAWRLEPAPNEGAIMPDCVAIGLAADGTALPYMVGDQDAFVAIVMPVSSSKVLVGRARQVPDFAFVSLNERLAECCETFFIAANDNADFVGLSHAIGKRSALPIDAAIEEVLSDFALLKPQADPHTEDVAETDEPSEPVLPTEGWQLSIVGCGDDPEWLERVRNWTQGLVLTLARKMPLERLDGITFANDYAAALRDLDRGIAVTRPLEPTSNEIGLGIAMSPAVVRDCVIKRRVVAHAAIAEALVGQDEDLCRWAIHALASQLAVVALTQIVDETLPGILMKPTAKPIDGFLYQWVGSALDGYIVARECACYAPDTYPDEQRTLLVGTLNQAREAIPAARLDYRYHGNLDRLLDVAMPAVGYVLDFAAHLLGHCDAAHVSPFDTEGTLEAALKECGFLGWFAQFQRDLASFCERIGSWESFDEFLAFNRHVERLAWQFGLVPFETTEGELRVQVPLSSDIAKLIEATAHGVMPPHPPPESS